MKEYHASSIIAIIPFILMAPFAIIADYASDWFVWAYDLFFLALLLCVIFYTITPYKYFPLFTSMGTTFFLRATFDFVIKKSISILSCASSLLELEWKTVPNLRLEASVQRHSQQAYPY